MRLIASLVIAFSTYSRIPMPRVDWRDENRRYALCFFPLIGLVIGGGMGLWLWLCQALALGGLLRGAVAAAIPLLITGGIHMDGFMDTCDALASWQPPQKRLEILKDSHIGAFAALWCGVYLLIMAGLYSECAIHDALPLAACFLLSRALSAMLSVYCRQALPCGMLDGFSRTAAGRAVKACG
ncbi:MAG: adenosylcobinamide-GDP ribazoletransferase, partial [Clostridia bacterium]|nr:adenosylcobinamide-GDP ribazoletransferase [Clostridia bacterium]